MKKAAMEEVPVGDTKLCDSVNQLKTGLPADAAEDLKDRMCMQNSIAKYYGRRAKEVEGIQEEVDQFVKDRLGNSEAQEVGELLHYIRREETSEKEYKNGTRDKGRNGKKLAYFLEHDNVKDAKLSEAEVVAMRLYTTIAFKFMNYPLRDKDRYIRNEECPLPVTTAFALDGVKKMRQLHTKKKTKGTANNTTEKKPDEVSIPVDQQNVLWRGMSNLEVSKEFMVHGGTELAFMSTTTDLNVAVRYCLSPNSLLFKIVSDSFMTMGADVQWLSAFPSEAEVLYPPLTYLKPTGRTQVTLSD
jgi:hypothetical protein